MIEVEDDLWNYHDIGFPVVITTNGIVRGESNVMGRGVALQAAQRFPSLPRQLGRTILATGNHVYWFQEFRLLTFPTKHDWHDKSDLTLIERSAYELKRMADRIREKMIFLPRPGTGSGGLLWSVEVKPVIEPILDDRFVIVNRG